MEESFINFRKLWPIIIVVKNSTNLKWRNQPGNLVMLCKFHITIIIHFLRNWSFPRYNDGNICITTIKITPNLKNNTKTFMQKALRSCPFAFRTRSICVPKRSICVPKRSICVPKRSICVPKRSSENVGTRSLLWWDIVFSRRMIPTPNETRAAVRPS